MLLLMSALQAAQSSGLDRTRAGCRVADGTRPERQLNLAPAFGSRTTMRPHLVFSLISPSCWPYSSVSVRSSPAAPRRPPLTPTTLAWSPCADADGWECATLPVPLDYADPTGPRIDLALTRMPAADPARRIGALVVNCGGPAARRSPFCTSWAPSFSRTRPGSIRSRRLRPPRRGRERPDRLQARLRGLLCN